MESADLEDGGAGGVQAAAGCAGAEGVAEVVWDGKTVSYCGEEIDAVSST